MTESDMTNQIIYIMAVILGILIIVYPNLVAYIVGFMTIQANTITTSIHNYFKIEPLTIGIILAVISAFSIPLPVKIL